MNEQHPDQGFTLIEVLLVILVLGLLAAVVVTSVGGMKAEADDTACDGDAHVLMVATEAFFARRAMDEIPAANGTADAYEQTLVDEEFLRSPSTLFDLDATGALTPASGSTCTVPA